MPRVSRTSLALRAAMSRRATAYSECRKEAARKRRHHRYSLLLPRRLLAGGRGKGRLQKTSTMLLVDISSSTTYCTYRIHVLGQRVGLLAELLQRKEMHLEEFEPSGYFQSVYRLSFDVVSPFIISGFVTAFRSRYLHSKCCIFNCCSISGQFFDLKTTQIFYLQKILSSGFLQG